MREGSSAMAIAFAMVLVTGVTTLMFPGHGWFWLPVLVALLLGGVVAKVLG